MFAVIKAVAGVLVGKIFASPLKFATLIKFGYGLLDDVQGLKSSDKGVQVDSGVRVARKILKFKRENREEFDFFCESVEELLEKYESDKDMRNAILEKLK